MKFKRGHGLNSNYINCATGMKKTIKTVVNVPGGQGEDAPIIEREKGCFKSQSARMNYKMMARRGWPIGCGVVESDCRQQHDALKDRANSGRPKDSNACPSSPTLNTTSTGKNSDRSMNVTVPRCTPVGSCEYF
jgi:hypothetical protein